MDSVKSSVVMIKKEDLFLLGCLFISSAYVFYDPLKYLNLLILSVFFFSVFTTDKVFQIKSFLALTFTSNEYLIFAAGTVYIVLSVIELIKYRVLNKLQLLIVAFLLYSFLSFVIGTVQNIFYFNYFFWIITVGTPLFVIFYFLNIDLNEVEKKSIFLFFYKILFLELIIVPVQILYIFGYFKHGDAGVGTLGDAHTIGYYMVFLLFSTVIGWFIVKKGWQRNQFMWILPLLISAVLYFSDAKVIYLVIILVLPIYLILLLIFAIKHINNYISIKKLFLTTVASVIFLFGIPFFINVYLSSLPNSHGLHFSKVLDDYLDADIHGYKAEAYRRTYMQMYRDEPFLWYFFGTGPGFFDSRASNILAYDTLAKKGKGMTLIPPYSSVMSKEYLSDLYTEDILLTSHARSALLSYPFSGLISLKAELGLFGLFLYITILFVISIMLLKKIDKYASRFLKRNILLISLFIFTLPFLMLFDNFHEKPQISYVIFTLATILLSPNSIKSTSTKKTCH